MTNETQQTILDAEEAILGSLLVDGEAIFEVSGELRPEHFHQERHATVYRAFLALHGKGEEIHQISVAHELAQEGKLEAIGGSAYLAHLISITPTSVYIKHYAKIVMESALKRELAAIGRRMQEGANDSMPPDKLLSETLARLREMKVPGRKRLLTPKDRAERALTTLSQRMSGELESLSFGFVDLDSAAGGMTKGEVTLIGARPGIGKSTIIQQIAEYSAREGKAVFWVSAEMPDTQLTDRKLASETGISMWRIMNPNTLEPEEWEKLQGVVNSIANEPIYFPGEGALTTDEIEARAREIQLEVGLALIVIDYLQLLTDDVGRSPYERVSYISRRLKQIAMSLEVPILAVSQLNRAPEGREDKRPTLSDLRDSGSLEQDADIILMLFREDAYYSEASWGDTRAGRRGKDLSKGILEVHVAKHRQLGARSEPIKLMWDGKRRQYRNYQA